MGIGPSKSFAGAAVPDVPMGGSVADVFVFVDHRNHAVDAGVSVADVLQSRSGDRHALAFAALFFLDDEKSAKGEGVVIDKGRTLTDGHSVDLAGEKSLGVDGVKGIGISEPGIPASITARSTAPSNSCRDILEMINSLISTVSQDERSQFFQMNWRNPATWPLSSACMMAVLIMLAQ